MIELLIRHGVLLALAAGLNLLLRRRSAALRHALWTTALTLLLVLPLLQRVPITLPDSLSRSLPVIETEKETSRAHIEGTPVELITPSEDPQAAPAHSLPWGTIALAAYAMVTLALIARWGVGWALAAQLTRRAIPLGTARGVPVLAARGVGPLTFGWPRGVILVPHERFALEKLVLRHEVAHVKRADFLWQGIGALACALWWWSPLVWLAARQLRREAERACDDFVLNQGVSAPDYADCLLEVAAMKPLSLPFAASLVQGELAARVTALLAPGKDRRPAGPLAVLGITTLLVPVGLTLTRPVAADVPQAPVVLPSAPSTPAPRSAPHVVPAAPPVKRSAPKLVTLSVQKAPPVLQQPIPVALPKTVGRPAPESAPEERDTPAPKSLLKAPVVSEGPAPAPEPEPASDSKEGPVSLPAPRVIEAEAESPVLAGSLVGKRIVLDAGHGGTDHGAPSTPEKKVPVLKDLPIVGKLFTQKVSEKDVTLQIALKAAERLRKEGAIVTLTRDSDTFLNLNKRSEFSVGQDLYLSIHVDSSEARTQAVDNKAFRVAVWYHAPSVPAAAPGLSPTPVAPAIDTQVGGRDQSQRLATGIMSALTMPEPTPNSSFAGIIAPDGKVYSSGFAVLRNAKCPAFLIDFGNMSLPGDVARLRDGAFQDKLAQGIVEGAKAIL